MPLEADTWILEGLLTTLGPPREGATPIDRVHVAPMGPIVNAAMSTLVLRPFRESTTFRNLKATGAGVFHVTDDVLLIARSAIGRVAPGPDLPARPAQHVAGVVLAGSCRYYELEVAHVDDREPRARVEARVAATGRIRDFFGFNRARHAVLEAAILATRLHLTGSSAVLDAYRPLRELIDKTGSRAEHTALDLLEAHVRAWPHATPDAAKTP